ncbi:MAG: nitrite reductase, copper-containing [Alphaproteobacteria bacterium]|nr:nitrite reductase, copper-containing [Alphaproteobacteria bacterium]MDE2112976.1 nitrite reductase, copper-containing [Alphaproteobacteria bacterium]MDE2492311.1 nitrite reductase, copper-containing [Alphaproteobacteria bacterium]
MFPKKRKDWALLGAVMLIGAAAFGAWTDSSGGPNIVTGAIAAPALSQPANYTAPPLSGTTATPLPKAGSTVDIVRDPTDLPPPVGDRGPRRINVTLYTEEVTGTLADATTYRYWTFNGKVPGPFIRMRVGDIVTVYLTNDPASAMIHNVDMHAVLGPGGGAPATVAAPGETKSFTFKVSTPGLFVYHCATMPVGEHIANGMFGMILVEPAGGLPRVDREFYVMQNEIYTDKPFGTQGLLGESYAKLMAETPEYYVFNGAVSALTDHRPLRSKVGETVRIFFGDAGPNKTSSFHVIGEIFDKAYQYGSLESPPLRGVQTMSVPPGDAAIVEFQTRVPGTYLLVDHAIVRVERGLVGDLIVDGPRNDELFKAD